MPTDERPDRTPSSWRRLLPRDPWQVVLGPILVLLVGAGITAATRGGSEEPASELRALPPLVRNGPDFVEQVEVRDASGEVVTASRQAEKAKPHIDVRLHNVGKRRSVLTSARFTVTRFARIVPCGRGAGLFASAAYEVVLPRRPRSGEVIEVPINQQLGPDRADRFTFRLGAEPDERDLGTTAVYELRIAVLHDNEPEPLEVGRVVVALPGVPFADASRPEAPYGDFVVGADGCSPVPPPAVRRVARFRGVRSPELDRFLRYVASAGR